MGIVTDQRYAGRLSTQAISGVGTFRAVFASPNLSWADGAVDDAAPVGTTYVFEIDWIKITQNDPIPFGQ
jgi:hypothetical protein